MCHLSVTHLFLYYASVLNDSLKIRQYRRKGTRLFRRVSEVLLCFPSVEAEADLRMQLIECRAQLEHWQGVARICELSKQEELQELQKQCDQEVQSLQEALRGEEGLKEVEVQHKDVCGLLINHGASVEKSRTASSQE